MLGTYFILVLVVLVLLIAGAVLGLRNDNEEIRNLLKNELPKYGRDTAFTEAWDSMQSELHCCGVDNSLDWLAKGVIIPSSCELQYYAQGCWSRIYDGIFGLNGTASYIGISIIALLFINMLFSFALCMILR